MRLSFDVHGRSTSIGNEPACCSEAAVLRLTTDGHQAVLQGQQVLLARAKHCTTPHS
jgi:hypothetical protein